MKFYNTLTKKKQEFAPLEKGKIRIYTCGLTVNNIMHIGHARSYIVWDIFIRYFKYLGYKVKHVSNVTDIAIDDKILKEIEKQKISFQELVEKNTYEYWNDRESLGIERADVHPLATQHVQEMIEVIGKLIEKGYAYVAEDGIYFDIRKFKNYGKLSGVKVEELKTGASGRAAGEEYDKEHAGDFVLWKMAKPGEISWYSPWGIGRPGWHIECSAMSMKYLGDTLDIHAGGEDNIFPHHENEIAQSEAATGKTFSNYWLHTKHVLLNNQKMSKSTGNFITSRDAVKKYTGSLIRFFFLNTHYRSQIDFNDKDMPAVQAKLEKLKDCINLVRSFSDSKEKGGSELLKIKEKAKKDFEDAMNDDFNTSMAITSLLELVKEINKYFEKNSSISSKASKELSDFFSDTGKIIFGDLFEKEILQKNDKSFEYLIDVIVEQREDARKKKDFEKSDKIRKHLSDIGIIIEDTPSGARWKRK